MSRVNGILAPKAEGAFYSSVVFKSGALKPGQKLPISNKAIEQYIEKKVEGEPLDKRFVYYLLGATGICVVPLSGFNSPYPGFRSTLLEQDEALFKKTYDTIAGSLTSYLSS